MKKRELFPLLEGFGAVKDLPGVKFAYAVAKNNKAVTAEVETIQESAKFRDDFEAYEKARLELVKAHAVLEDNGEPKVNGVGYIIKADERAMFDAAAELLRTEHKDACDHRDEQLRDYSKLLEEDTDIDLHKVKQEDLPEAITGGQMAGIFEMVAED